MRKNFLCFLLFALLFASNSCGDKDAFSTDTHLRLSFSIDTLRFDTVFTTLGSATKDFRIYNDNNKALNVETIELVNAEKSGFRINVDGETGTNYQNLSIPKNDSLFAFVEVTVDPKNDKPLHIYDSIRFVTNGNEQYVYLEAIGKDVYILKGHRITQNVTLPNDKPYLIYDSLVVDKDVRLTLGENTTFYFHNKASFKIYGSVSFLGSAEQPVVFRGDRLDYINKYVPYDNLSGQWGGLYIGADSYDNIFENTYIRNSETGIVFHPSGTDQKKATLKNTIIQNTTKDAFVASNCDIEASNCLFANSGGATLSLKGGKYRFQHCTIANYYRLATRRSSAVVLANSADAESGNLSCEFSNSIVYGSHTNEILLIEDDNKLNCKFNACLLKGNERSDSRFSGIIWNQDPMFMKGDYISYSYDFRLSELSPARDVADRTFSVGFPCDIAGNSRFEDNNPDLGCYEWAQE